MKSPASGNDITASAHQGFGDPDRQLLDPGLRNQAHHRVGDAVALSVGDGKTVMGGDPRRDSGAASGIMAGGAWGEGVAEGGIRTEEHTSELQSLMRISSAVFFLKKTTL